MMGDIRDMPSTSRSSAGSIRNSIDDLFYFESDNLALKGNKDYNELIKTIAILEAQKVKAITDIDRLVEVQKFALENPEAILIKLQNKEDLGVPGPQKIAELPEIDWSKYNIPIPENTLKQLDEDNPTEAKQNDLFKTKIQPKLEETPESTFNKPWSAAEQKKLEELLIKYPPEVVELRRYKKIADALGNRTVKQVTSRVQKYFLKLHRAGLPIPGRIPKGIEKKRVFAHKHHRHNSYLYKPTTFFPDMDVPVHMPENDDAHDDESSSSPYVPQPSSSQKTELEMKIEILEKIKEDKKQSDNMPLVEHHGFECDTCKESPIMGIRLHCKTCEDVDFCQDCYIEQLLSKNYHPLTHEIISVKNAEQPESVFREENDEPSSSTVVIKSEPESQSESDTGSETSDSFDNLSPKLEIIDHDIKTENYDKDYYSDIFSKDTGNYNYLDPNFLPK